MDDAAVAFFRGSPESIPIYEALEHRVLTEVPHAEARVQKTQISFYNRHMFACASLLRPIRKASMPNPYVTVSIGLTHGIESTRAAACVEVRPNRWTNHVPLGSPEEVDDELMAWIAEAAELSEGKR
ncbi:MAG: DUF5655 domain-containing protein [Acidobacteriota bacterium]|nr:DUF5655 domain-containing protein [Acidobacteriota bacterium]